MLINIIPITVTCVDGDFITDGIILHRMSNLVRTLVEQSTPTDPIPYDKFDISFLEVKIAQFVEFLCWIIRPTPEGLSTELIVKYCRIIKYFQFGGIDNREEMFIDIMNEVIFQNHPVLKEFSIDALIRAEFNISEDACVTIDHVERMAQNSLDNKTYFDSMIGFIEIAVNNSIAIAPTDTATLVALKYDATHGKSFITKLVNDILNDYFIATGKNIFKSAHMAHLMIHTIAYVLNCDTQYMTALGDNMRAYIDNRVKIIKQLSSK